jgi:hypothetical protein
VLEFVDKLMKKSTGIKSGEPGSALRSFAALNLDGLPPAAAADTPMRLAEAASPYKTEVWRRLTPRERLRRSWEMRSRLPDLKAVHDRKLFPKP